MPFGVSFYYDSWHPTAIWFLTSKLFVPAGLLSVFWLNWNLFAEFASFGYTFESHEQAGGLCIRLQSHLLHLHSPPDLKHVKPEERKKYRQQYIQEWLDQMLVRAPRECFGHYIGRVHAVATRELKFNQAARQCVGDEFPHFLDRYVWRILQGARLCMIKHGVIVQPEVEKQYYALLREEVEELFNDQMIIPDPRQKMLPGDTWVHEGQHCASSRAARECGKMGYEPQHVQGHHEADCDGAAGKNFQSIG